MLGAKRKSAHVKSQLALTFGLWLALGSGQRSLGSERASGQTESQADGQNDDQIDNQNDGQNDGQTDSQTRWGERTAGSSSTWRLHLHCFDCVTIK